MTFVDVAAHIVVSPATKFVIGSLIASTVAVSLGGIAGVCLGTLFGTKFALSTLKSDTQEANA